MRVLGVLAALVATPVLVGMSQDRGQSAAGAANCATADANRSPTAAQNSGQPDDKKGRERVGCSPAAAVPAPVVPPTSPPPPPPAPATSTIDGTVYYDMESRPGLPAWVVDLAGPVSASVVTDAWGRFSFAGLPDGTYTVCEQVPVSWVQTYPTRGATCASGFGYSFTLANGASGSGVNFGNTIRMF